MTFIENTLTEHHLLEGEALLDAKAVLEVLQIEKKLWSVMVKDNGILEVEIQNPNHKTQKSTCECNEYNSEGSCPHIAAALLHLRDLQIRQEEEKKKRDQEKQKQTFNIRTILENVELEQLKNYVRSYAQKDRTFGIMLKASFSKSIDLPDNIVKYASILNSVIKPVSTEKLKSTTSELRLALKVIDEYHDQVQDSLSVSQFDDAFIIIKATLPKLHYMYAKYPKVREKAANWIAHFHSHLDILYSENLAPKFKKSIDEFIVEVADKSYYNRLQNTTSLFLIADKNKRKECKSKLLESILREDVSDVRESSSTVFCAILIIAKHYEKLKVSDDKKLEALQYLLQSEYESNAIEYLEYFLKNERRNRKMEATLINAYLHQNKKNKFAILAVDIFVRYEDFRYYRLLKEKIVENQWNDIKNKIESAIQEYEPASAFEANYYYNEEMKDRLIIILEENLDLRIIMKYDHYLYIAEYISLERIYHKAVSAYLDQHVGAVATNFIQEIYHHLSSVKAYKLEVSLKKMINTQYPHRQNFINYS